MDQTIRVEDCTSTDAKNQLAQDIAQYGLEIIGINFPARQSYLILTVTGTPEQFAAFDTRNQY